MKFTKMQGAGNDFIVVEAVGNAGCDWSRLAKTVCDRHFGIGADGVLLLLPSDRADFRMRIFNSDGSEAEACGNGLRCLTRYAADNGLLSGRKKCSRAAGVAGDQAEMALVETMAGTRNVWLHRAGGKIVRVQTAMGEPGFGAEDIPAAIGQGDSLDIKQILDYPVTIGKRQLRLGLVSMGNPHAVHFEQQSPSEFPLAEIGPAVEKLAMFPRGVNFEVARVVSREQVEARVWERGVGETQACGSGACAIAVIARLRGYVGDKVDIKLPGGMLDVEWDGAGEVLLGGPAEMVFTGEWPDGG
ncbi:MAG: diaminopimelate epimerase [Chloroflexi bacterium]|nr:diaminopimelate epimerase [Chloroflexota bacterium]